LEGQKTHLVKWKKKNKPKKHRRKKRQKVLVFKVSKGKKKRGKRGGGAFVGEKKKFEQLWGRGVISPQTGKQWVPTMKKRRGEKRVTKGKTKWGKKAPWVIGKKFPPGASKPKKGDAKWVQWVKDVHLEKGGIWKQAPGETGKKKKKP